MRVLITGISGFVGSHFAEYALGQGARVCGSQWGSDTGNIDHLRDRVELIECDLRDMNAVRHLLDAAGPDLVIHLAAQSSVGASWRAPGETLVTNVLAQVNLLEAICARVDRPRVLVIGSSEEYGHVEPGDLPITEEAPLRPLSPYALSKVAQNLMGYQYFRSHGLPVVRSRAFNHEGPRRSDAFVTSNFSRQIAEIEAGVRPPLVKVGDLKTRRDYTDVRDIVRGYWLLLTGGEPGEVYNLCSGRTWLIGDILEFLLTQTRVRGIEVQEDIERLRPADVPVIYGDAGKIRAALGWEPVIPFEQTLRDTLEYWRERMPGGAA